MSGIAFHKYVSIGNDFVLIEEESLPSTAEEDELHTPQLRTPNSSALAQRVCDRNFGVGSDGLLTWAMDGGRISMRMFNPDGTEDFCGNGLRCAALHARRSGIVSEELPISHFGKDVSARFGPGGWIDVRLPEATFDPQRVPLAGPTELFEVPIEIGGEQIVVSAVSTGSTHTVILTPELPADPRFEDVSSAIENHPMFPARTSVIWVRPVSEKRLLIRIWERGVGETLGCGTGSAAAAACWFRKTPGIVAVQVENPGGDCMVARGPNGGLMTSARAEWVYSGRLA